MQDTRKLPSERLIPSCSGPAVCMEPGQPGLMHQERFAASGRRLAACGYRQNPRFKSPTIHRDFEPLASWPPATDKGQPLLRFPTWSGCSHPEQRGIETRMNRLLLSPPVASATRSGSRTTFPAKVEDRKVRSRKPGTSQEAPRKGGTWERTSPHGTAAVSERWRSRKGEPFFAACGRKAQGSNERQPVATPAAAADLTRGARP